MSPVRQIALTTTSKQKIEPTGSDKPGEWLVRRPQVGLFSSSRSRIDARAGTSRSSSSSRATRSTTTCTHSRKTNSRSSAKSRAESIPSSLMSQRLTSALVAKRSRPRCDLRSSRTCKVGSRRKGLKLRRRSGQPRRKAKRVSSFCSVSSHVLPELSHHSIPFLLCLSLSLGRDSFVMLLVLR